MPLYIANNDFISVQNSDLQRLISESRLKSLSVSITKNCCPNAEIGLASLMIETPSILKCKYKVRYCKGDGSFIYDGREECNVNINISHDCFNGLLIDLAYFNGQTPIDGCNMDVWVDGITTTTTTDTTGHALVSHPIDGNGTYNIQVVCCGNSIKRTSYTVSNCVGNHITVPFQNNNQGDTFYKIYELYLYHQGVEHQILKRQYDVSIPSEALLLQADINRWLKSNCRNGSASVLFDSINECVEITIYDVSKTVIPIKLKAVSNFPFFYLEKKFTCSHYEDISLCESNSYTKCNSFELIATLSNSAYEISYFTIQDLDCEEDKVPLSEGSNNYIYVQYSNNLHSGNLSILRNSIIQYYNNLGVVVDVEITIEESKLKILISNDTRLNIPLRLFIRNISTGIIEDYLFVCKEYNYKLTDCTWNVRFETMNECGYIQYGYLTEKQSFKDVPQVIDQDSFYLKPDNDFILVSKLLAKYPGAHIDIKRENGIAANSILNLTISSISSIPYGLILFDQTDKICYLFTCQNMTYVVGEDNCRSKITVSNDSVYLFPNILNVDKFTVGVYEVNLTLEDTEGKFYNKKYCVFNGYDIECILPEVVKSNPNTNAVSLYAALVESKNCEQCECDVYCSIYKALAKEITASNSNSKSMFNECGC